MSSLSLSLSDSDYRRELGEGLVPRWTTARDAEQVAFLYGQVFRNGPDDPPHPRLPLWLGDLMSGRHPLMGPADVAVVEDTRRGAIVAATCLLSQVWEYGGVACPVGRPEIVASDPDYRDRGLVRAVFALIHARSEAQGHLAQGITGIPYYYRQFGYEYALDLGGGRDVRFDAIPPLTEGTTERVSLRDATVDDIPLVRDLYDRERSRAAVSTRVDEPYWRWMLEGKNPDIDGWRIQLIADRDAAEPERPIGYAILPRRRSNNRIEVGALGVREGVSLVALQPSLLRALRAQASLIAADPDIPPASRLLFELGRAHPFYETFGPTLAATPRRHYAWYVRVPDLPAFIRHVAPVLEARLAASVATGYSGELTLNFYRGGLRLTFQGGRLTGAEEWRVPTWGRGDVSAGFPPLVFLQLLFGHRSLAELRQSFPDVWTSSDAVDALLQALFPTQPTWVLPLD